MHVEGGWFRTVVEAGSSLSLVKYYNFPMGNCNIKWNNVLKK